MSLVDLAEELNLTSEDLDDLVHDAASMKASDINNQGLYEQLEYLVNAFGEEEVEQILRSFV